MFETLNYHYSKTTCSIDLKFTELITEYHKRSNINFLSILTNFHIFVIMINIANTVSYLHSLALFLANTVIKLSKEFALKAQMIDF